ncbi:MAG: amidohydrolase family protein [Candidatus Kerfeldbacteria bacterium]|nr:amidohydrolase family protein [Candidatus Kerfeldbacteria bacterium]
MQKPTSIISIVILVLAGIAAWWLFAEPGANSIIQPLSERRVEAAFKAVDCDVKPRVFPAGAYTGPLYDMHVHIASIPDGPPGDNVEPGEGLALGVNTSIEDYLCMLNVEGTAKALAFFPVWEPVKPMLEVVKRTMDKYADRFIPFIMPPANDGSPTGFPTVTAAELTEMLKVHPALFQGYGEIGLYARDDGAPELPPDSERLMQIYPVVREYNLLVYFHLGQGQKEAYERVLEQNPDIAFIFHGDQLVEDAGGGDNLQLIDEILTKYSNVYYGIDELYGDVFLMREGVSKETFLAHFKNPEPLLEKDLKTWKWFIEKHPDRVLWDTDRGGSVRWALDPDLAIVLNDYSRMFIGRLDPAVQEKFVYQNAERLVAGR